MVVILMLENLKRLRIERNMTQMDLALDLGIQSKKHVPILFFHRLYLFVIY